MGVNGVNFNQFNHLHIEDLKKVQLLNRQDTKFIFNQANLHCLLEKLKPNYHILEINGNFTFHYENTYFDSEDFVLYRQHHNEKRNRFKVRYRNYTNTNDQFFEIKIKNNKNRTTKERFRVKEINDTLQGKAGDLVAKFLKISPDYLLPRLNIQFSRITMVDKGFTERLTIDTDLSVKNGVTRKIFDQLVISEIKQNKYNPKSEFIQALRELKIPEMRFSKYCMGILHVYKGIKYNRFKPKLLLINKLLNHENLQETN